MKVWKAILKLGGLVGTSHPRLPSDHPASIQFSAYLSVFNTADGRALPKYHNGSAFPCSVVSHDVANIEREMALAKGSGGLNVVDIESASDLSTVVVVIK